MARSRRWKSHIQAWQESGLTQAAYCRQHGLSAKTFSGRLHYFRSREVSPAPELIPVQVLAPPSGTEGVVLRHAQGHRLELPTTVSPQWLAELLRCLG
jgi:hypothetical protein